MAGARSSAVEPLSAADVSDLTSFVVAADATVRDALQSLRANRSGVVAVVGDDGRTVGALTDDDIRRAALAGTSLDVAVTRVMPTNPAVVGAELTDAEIVQVLRSRRLRAVAVVEEGTLLGIRSLKGFPDPGAAPVAVIMAGGRGQRLRPFTDKVPKPLLKVGSTSIVERIIGGLAAAGVGDVYLAVNYKAEIFEQRLGSGDHLGVRLHYLRESTEMGTAGALGLLPPGQTGPILVTNGDLVTTIDFARLFDFHWRHGGAVTVAAVEYLSPIPYGVLRTAEHHLISIEEKPERRDLCSGGIYVLEPDVLQLMPPLRRLDMPELIATVLSEGLPVHVFPILEKWFDIGGTAEFERVLVQFSIGEDE